MFNLFLPHNACAKDMLHKMPLWMWAIYYGRWSAKCTQLMTKQSAMQSYCAKSIMISMIFNK